ncbi:MAG: hypothetical protein Q9220_005841 [cf. Caloplaca sp. 1 TL-2023]
MAADSAYVQSLSSLLVSLNSAIDSLPSSEGLAPPSDGLSLLDTKNELFLSYLQNLVFLILYKLRAQRTSLQAGDERSEPAFDDIVKTLVSLRIYLEKGIRPLESRLKYQLDKLLLTASEATPSQFKPQPTAKKSTSKPANRSSSASTSPSASDSEQQSLPVSDLSHRPNLSAFTRKTSYQSSSTRQQRDTNIYRPPRITPTTLPTTTTSDRRENADNRKRKSNAMLDTFVREELSSAPTAEPSIGAGNGLRGKDADRERERREYEELRLVRLPSEGGKKKKGKGRVGSGFDEVLGGAGEGLGEAVRGSGGKKRKLGGASGGGGNKWG